MSPLLLRAFVNDRLTAVVEEIFQVFEQTIAKYEEEASSSKQEVERLKGQLLQLENQRTDISQLSSCKDETHCEQESTLSSIEQSEPELRIIKQEDHELWTADHQEEVGEGVFYPPHHSVWEDNEQEDAKPPSQPRIQSCNAEDEHQEMQEEKSGQFDPSPASALPSQHKTAAGFPSHQTEQGQMSFILSRESTESSDFSLTGADYQCHLCTEKFSSSHRLINHAFRNHSRDVSIMCAVCGRTIESSESLDLHLKSHKNSKCCLLCGKQCKNATSLTEHMASHAGLKLHRCHVCGKECSRKGDLKIHMRIHTGEKPFRCFLCCKSFTHSGHLKKHIRSHMGERPHRCDVCGKAFLQRTHLKSHLGTHRSTDGSIFNKQN
ncbi:zinc finger protein 583 [Kryptolebias marmoratus]|uniref:zinc finger protein 583 n=1 Tax=Kryptolebias marmoratus TaxID=37003 RepID=UPI0007F8F29F|nr:zinc finger protein 583 [Kryptolebias marmoratus]